jgi:hypothetical protein
VRSAAELYAVCRLLGVDPGWLLGFTDVQHPWPPLAADAGGTVLEGAAAGSAAETMTVEPPRVEDAVRGLDETRRLLRKAERALEAARAALRHGPPRQQP